jgi:hypothetical protein
MPWARNDESSVLFKRLPPNAALSGCRAGEPE